MTSAIAVLRKAAGMVVFFAISLVLIAGLMALVDQFTRLQ